MSLVNILEICGAVVVVALFCYMMLVEQFSIRVTELQLSFPNLPEKFDGYTILHLSDQHLTKLGKLEKLTMDIISSREVDTCFITGDVTAQPRASDIFRRVCSVIKHRDPLVMVLGNSEHKPWLDSEMLVNALTFDGLHMLINSSMTIEREGEKIVVAGVDDAYYKLADLDAAFEGVDPNDFIVFLTHCPSTTPEGIDHGADLVLAGHTHGGQVRFPGLKFFWTHMHHFQILNGGLYTSSDLSRILRRKVNGSKLFVSRGIGTSKLHIRFFCPPEIAYIKLIRECIPETEA